MYPVNNADLMDELALIAEREDAEREARDELPQYRLVPCQPED